MKKGKKEPSAEENQNRPESVVPEEDIFYADPESDDASLEYSDEDDDEEDTPNPTRWGEEGDDDDLQYAEEDEDDSEAPHKGKKGRSAMGIFFTVLAVTMKGWRELKNSRMSAEDYAAGCYYPLLALASASMFADIFYREADVAQCLKGAIVVFVSFFASYFLLWYCGTKLLPGDSKKHLATPFGKKFCMTLLGSLALFFTAYTLFQPIGEVLTFLPIYTLFILFKGVKYLRLPKEKETLGLCTLCILTLGIPMLIAYLFIVVLNVV